MKKALILATTLLGLLTTSAFAGPKHDGPAKNGYLNQKVVYHVNDIHTAGGALRNIKNQAYSFDFPPCPVRWPS